MIWAEFEADAPELAATAREELERRWVVLVGTLRSDGSPRISCVAPSFLDGELYLGMMWRSRKAVDLLRDPRIVVHNPICSNRGDEVEVSVHGRAIELRDDAARARFLEDETNATSWGERRFHLFSVDIGSVGVVQYEGGKQHVHVWPKGVDFTRSY